MQETITAALLLDAIIRTRALIRLPLSRLLDVITRIVTVTRLPLSQPLGVIIRIRILVRLRLSAALPITTTYLTFGMTAAVNQDTHTI